MTLLDQLRDADRERHFATLFAPAGKREALAALALFEIDVARVVERAREPAAGEIRLQWWREALAGERGPEAAGNPIASALLGAIARFKLPVAAFDRLLDARVADLYHDPVPDRAALEALLGETRSVPLALAAQILADGRDAGIADACGHGGVALGCVALLQSLARDRARGRVTVPLAMLAATGSDAERFASAQDAAEAAPAVAALVALAREHFASFRSAARPVPAALRPALLPVAAAQARLPALERAGGRLAIHSLRQPVLRPILAMARRAVMGWR